MLMARLHVVLCLALSLSPSLYLSARHMCVCIWVFVFNYAKIHRQKPEQISTIIYLYAHACAPVCAPCVCASVCALCVCVRVPLLAQVRWFCSASVGVNAPQMLSSVDLPLPPPAPSLVLSLSCMHKYLHCLQQLLMIEPSIICFCFCLFGNKESR